MEIKGIGSYGGIYPNARVAEKAAQPEQNKKAGASATNTDSVELSGGAAYLKNLQEQFPKMSLSVGTGFVGKTRQNTGSNANPWAFTVSPKLLEKMRNDPEAEEKYLQVFRDIERATEQLESYKKASGGKVVYCENYIDENGQLHHTAITVHEPDGDKQSDKAEKKDAAKNESKTSGRVGINAARLARQLAAAKTRSQVQAVLAQIKSDLKECDAGKAQGLDLDEASYSAAQRLLQEAQQRMGQAENREPTPEEKMAFALVIV